VRSLHAQKPSGGRAGGKGRLPAGVQEKKTLRGVKGGSAGPRVCDARHRSCAAPPQAGHTTRCTSARTWAHPRPPVGVR